VTLLGLYGGNPRDVLAPFAVAQSTSTFYRANQPRIGLYDSVSDANAVPMANGIMTAVPIQLAAGDVITNISFVTGFTAGATMTHWWMALYDSAATPNLLAQTADQVAGAIAASTVITKPLATAQTISKGGVYWVALMISATTQPSVLGTVGAPTVVTGERNLAVTSGSALAATATATLASPTVQRFVPYVVLT
jgi:hypothetical protein